MVGTLECEHTLALFARDHNRIHFSAADGAERILCFG
jgi:hypothetical protein